MVAEFKSSSPMTNELAILQYQDNFGNIAPGEIFMDYMPQMKGLKAIDRAMEIKQSQYERFPAELKAQIVKQVETKAALTTQSPLFATGTSYTGTSGSIPVLLPTVVDPQLYDRTRVEYPLSSGLIPRVAQLGIYADIIRQTALPTAQWKEEGAALDTTIPTYTRGVTRVRYLYGVGEITGPMMVASRVWQNALTLQQEAQFRAVKELEEDTILDGNPTAGTVDGTVSDENAFTGLVQSITTNNTNQSSARISLDDLRVAFRVIREARGEPDLIVTDHKTLADIRNLMQEVIRYPNPGDTLDFFGSTIIKFEGVPIVPTIFLPTSNGARELLVLTVKKGNNIQMRVMQEPTFQEMPSNADSYKFMVKEYVTMVIAHETWCYRYNSLA